jgi:hypothetical protein
VAADPSHFVSIVDKAKLRKKEINEGPSMPSRRRGELVAEDLLAVALEDGRPLHPGDAAALAEACDIPPEDLLLAASSPAGSPC